jgi:hypothetical protein
MDASRDATGRLFSESDAVPANAALLMGECLTRDPARKLNLRTNETGGQQGGADVDVLVARDLLRYKLASR